MKRLRVVTIVIAVIITMVTAQTVLATIWYAGNQRSFAYGIEAAINTPQSAPYLDAGAEYNYVTTAKVDSNWVQTGWCLKKGWSAAKRYVEHNINSDYDFHWYGTQGWGTNVLYKLVYTNGKWKAYIDELYREQWPLTAPTIVLGHSEVQDSSNNELDTLFANVYWKSSSGWKLFDQGNWSEHYPYAVEKTQYWYYRCYGP